MSRKEDNRKESGFFGDRESSPASSLLDVIEESEEFQESQEETSEESQHSQDDTQEPREGKDSKNDKETSKQKKRTIVRMSKVSTEIKAYSGLKADTKLHDGHKEPTAEDWCDRMESVGGAAGWDDTTLKSNAMLSMAPGSPADIWLKIQNKAEIKDWETLKDKLIEAFDPKPTIMQRLGSLNSLKQEKGERIDDYKNRVELQFFKFQRALAFVLSEKPEYKALNKEQKQIKEMVEKDVYAFVKCMIFMQGLQEHFLADITKSGEQELGGICRVANRTQEALGCAGKVRNISALTGAEEKPEQKITAAAIQSMIAAALDNKKDKKGSGEKKGEGKGKKKKELDLSKIGCYYCLTFGHFSSNCDRKKEDIGRGIYRPTIRCPPMSKEAYSALTQEEKNKGRTMLSSPGGAQGGSVGAVRSQDQGRREHHQQGRTNSWFSTYYDQEN